MKNVVSFRPGVIGNRNAFECMALIYKYLQDTYGFEFTMVKSEDDGYEDPAFKIISIPPKLWKPLPKTPFFSPSFSRLKQLTEIFKKADVLLTVDPTIYFQGLLAIRAGSRLGIPVLFDASMTITGNNRKLPWKLIRPILRKAYNQSTGAIVTVPKCIDRFSALGICNASTATKCTVMGHPVDTRMFKPLPKASEKDGILRVIAVSRLVPEKGLDSILKAMAPILSATKNVMLQIVGEGPMKNWLKKEVSERRLEEKVVFIEPVIHSALPQLIGASDIFINHAVPTPKWEEYFGAANIEAMSCGLPCVLTKCGGIPYVVRQPGTAILIKPRDVTGLQAAVNDLLTNKQLRGQMGKKASNYIKDHYDLPVIGEKYYRMLMAGTARP